MRECCRFSDGCREKLRDCVGVASVVGVASYSSAGCEKSLCHEPPRRSTASHTAEDDDQPTAELPRASDLAATISQPRSVVLGGGCAMARHVLESHKTRPLLLELLAHRIAPLVLVPLQTEGIPVISECPARSLRADSSIENECICCAVFSDYAHSDTWGDCLSTRAIE